MNHAIYFAVALACGSMLAIQASVNARLAAIVGGQPLVAAFISFSVGTLFLGVGALLHGNSAAVSARICQMPWWCWTGGVLGGVFVASVSFLAPKVGLVNLTFLLIMGQLLMSVIIDNFGLLAMPQRPLMWWKYAGLMIMLVGVIFFMFGEKIFHK